jgi:hypothetical protein
MLQVLLGLMLLSSISELPENRRTMAGRAGGGLLQAYCLDKTKIVPLRIFWLAWIVGWATKNKINNQ